VQKIKLKTNVINPQASLDLNRIHDKRSDSYVIIEFVNESLLICERREITHIKNCDIFVHL